jgi:hypothetical protein
MLGAMARIAPSQPNEAMARIASRRNGTISLDPSYRVKFPEKGSLNVDSKLLSKVQIDSKKGLRKSCTSPTIRRSAQQRFLMDPRCSEASFEVNSELKTGARPSARLCVGLIMYSFNLL